ncbi:MAG TPA: type II secretion system protein GspC [Myxococcota bacterium]|nr:type II secretion system protein GspC [Myxococcota bacterium]
MKKYFWTVNLLFLALGAWLLAGTINVVVAHKLRALPSFAVHGSKNKQFANYQNKISDDNQVIIERNYFNSAMAEPVPENSGPDISDEGAKDLLSGEGQPSDLRAALVGTVVASDHKWSMAMITDLTSSETDVYRIHDDLMDEARLVAILSRKVVINRNGANEYLELQEKANPKRPGQKDTNPHGRAESALGKGIKKSGKDSWTIDRSEIDKTLSNLNNIAMQARIVPSFKNGEANGFKLFAIRPGSVYSKLGIQNGDIIHKINGYAINSPDKALEIYQKLKSASSVDIEVTRRGTSKKLSYKIE